MERTKTCGLSGGLIFTHTQMTGEVAAQRSCQNADFFQDGGSKLAVVLWFPVHQAIANPQSQRRMRLVNLASNEGLVVQ